MMLLPRRLAMTARILATLLLLGAVTGCEDQEVAPVTANEDGSGKSREMMGSGGPGRGGGRGGFSMSGATVAPRLIGTGPDGGELFEYLLTNSSGMQVTLINFGATITSVNVPDRDEQYENVTLGFARVESNFDPGPYFGAICGRYANRIALGKFRIGNTEYSLATNNDTNHLHGGNRGFNRRTWTGTILDKNGVVGVRLHLESPDGEENYPGTLKVDVRYWLTEGNQLKIEYVATTDKATVLNLTNHCYWNLGGVGSGDILGHELTLDCDHFLPVDETMIPTGGRSPVADTPMDFQAATTIGSRIDQVPGGYDHCYVASGGGGTLKVIAEVHDPQSGRVMEISTTEPGIQLYTGNFLDGTPKSGGFQKHAGFCLECQHFPDSPNQPDFPTTLLEPGQTYTQTTVHRFSVRRGGEPGGGRGGRRKGRRGKRGKSRTKSGSPEKAGKKPEPKAGEKPKAKPKPQPKPKPKGKPQPKAGKKKA